MKFKATIVTDKKVYEEDASVEVEAARIMTVSLGYVIDKIEEAQGNPFGIGLEDIVGFKVEAI